jgi:hypothetical protein
VRWAVVEQAVVIGVVVPAPAPFRVVPGLLGQQGCLFRLELDGSVTVRVVFRIVHDVHGYEGMPRRPHGGRLVAVASGDVSASTGVPDDAYWQRPETPPGAADQKPSDPPADRSSGYAGPPRAAPPPPDWHPTVVPQPPPPRLMPSQDMDALDEEEGSARTVTYGIGLVAGAIGVILMCLLCARVLF